MSTLPPDPEGMNDRRAAWAASALSVFMHVTGTHPDTALPDMLCDLMHWCDRNEWSFDSARCIALSHYEAETEKGAGENQNMSATRPDPQEPKMPLWMRSIVRFERLEIRPCVLVVQYPDGSSYYEPCREREAEIWMVLGCYPDGSEEWCEEFPTKWHAMAFLDGLTTACPHLGIRRKRPMKRRRRHK